MKFKLIEVQILLPFQMWSELQVAVLKKHLSKLLLNMVNPQNIFGQEKSYYGGIFKGLSNKGLHP